MPAISAPSASATAPTSGHQAVADWLEMDARRLRAEVFGLNHLSWTRRVTLDGDDQFAPLLRDPAFQAGTMLKLFEPALIEQIGMWLNEYLYYFYYAEQAVARINADGRTRGEEIVALNQRLLGQLGGLDIDRDPAPALRVFYAYLNRRHATYMHYAQPEGPSMADADEAQRAELEAAAAPPASDSEGYAGVALGIIEALETGEPLYTALNVPNDGSIEGMTGDRCGGGELRDRPRRRAAAAHRRDPRAAGRAHQQRQALRAADGPGHRSALTRHRRQRPDGAPAGVVVFAREGPGGRVSVRAPRMGGRVG